MADTQRTVAAVLSLLADNTDGNISPQDVRDVVETLRNGHGEISITATVLTTITTLGTWVEAAGTFTLSPNNHRWTMATNARLGYSGPADSLCHIAASVSITAESNNQLVELAVAKNGVIITPSIVQRQIGTGSDVGSTALHAFDQVTDGDYLSIFVRNQSGTADITLETANLFVMSMPT